MVSFNVKSIKKARNYAIQKTKKYLSHVSFFVSKMGHFTSWGLLIDSQFSYIFPRTQTFPRLWESSILFFLSQNLSLIPIPKKM